MWVPVSLTSKVFDGCIKDLGFQSPPTPKTDWCLDLMIKSYDIKSYDKELSSGADAIG